MVVRLTDNGVVIGFQLAQIGHFEHDRWQSQEQIVRDVQTQQCGQTGELIGQFVHLIVRQVQIGEHVEFYREFRWNLLDHIRTQIAGEQLGVAHQVVDSIGYLHQLAFGEICKFDRRISTFIQNAYIRKWN